MVLGQGGVWLRAKRAAQVALSADHHHVWATALTRGPLALPRGPCSPRPPNERSKLLAPPASSASLAPHPAHLSHSACNTHAVPCADAPNESKLLALPGKGAFEQSAEWREKERKLVWNLKNLRGGREHTLRCRLTGVLRRCGAFGAAVGAGGRRCFASSTALRPRVLGHPLCHSDSRRRCPIAGSPPPIPHGSNPHHRF